MVSCAWHPIIPENLIGNNNFGYIAPLSSNHFLKFVYFSFSSLVSSLLGEMFELIEFWISEIFAFKYVGFWALNFISVLGCVFLKLTSVFIN